MGFVHPSQASEAPFQLLQGALPRIPVCCVFKLCCQGSGVILQSSQIPSQCLQRANDIAYWTGK